MQDIELESFNPCFIGTSSVAGVCEFVQVVYILVSILVLLELLLQHNIDFSLTLPIHVSILVLLELLLQHIVLQLIESQIDCFNPCFIGTSSVAREVGMQKKLSYGFQSLFYWNFFCSLDGIINLIHTRLFQSLFYWNFFCSRQACTCCQSTQQVSILVLSELLLQLYGYISFYLHVVLFQSLFYWNFFCSHPRAWHLHILLLWRFNPCFIGTSSVALASISTMIWSQCFNPCFIGTSSVALFVLQDLILDSGFNPCFIGTSSVA